MSYRITTPLLARSADIAERVAEAVIAGEMSSKEGAAAIYGARMMQAAVKTEVEARLTTLRVAAAIRAAMWRGGLRGRPKRKDGEISTGYRDVVGDLDAPGGQNCGALENSSGEAKESAACDLAAEASGVPE